MNVLPGLVLTALGFGCVLPTASVAITSGVEQRDQGLAGGLFTTCQQVGAATGLAILATVAAARTVHAHGSLTAGYRLSFMIATGIALVAAAIVARQLNAATRQRGLARQEQPAPEALPPTNPVLDLWTDRNAAVPYETALRSFSDEHRSPGKGSCSAWTPRARARKQCRFPALPAA